MKHLKELEARSIFILREAAAAFQRPVMLWSIGKDSTVLLWLARKAFFGRVPFPLLHVDTSFKLPEMLEYRDRIALEWNLEMVCSRNEGALAAGQTFPSGRIDRIACCRLLKRDALQGAVLGTGTRLRLNHATGRYDVDEDREPYDGVIVGIRADEEGSRSKERYFSARAAEGDWKIEEQPLEIWPHFKTRYAPGTHVRVHPLLDWTELNIWEYIDANNVPVIPLYYNQGSGMRYRSLGCGPCTKPIASESANAADVIAELRDGALARIAERAGRAQDQEDGGGLESLRREGYM